MLVIHSQSRARLVSIVTLLLLFGCTKPASQDAVAEAEEKSPAKPKHTNRLADETSPYLLLHAHNPVDWYPWGEEALTKAKKENKVIFLSVGYSSCHWCHVMERESFMDEEIAKFMNEHFVCIKVDREERPDVDSIYMLAVQIISKRGGWPMSVFMTPDAKPFYGATYFPARDGDRAGSPGFLTVLKRVHELWGERGETLREDADRVTSLIKMQLDGGGPVIGGELTESISDQVQKTLQEQFDPKYGGFGFVETEPQRPKFPEPSNLIFLVQRAGDTSLDAAVREQARQILTETLDHMAWGGIRDHIGGGFHRYSVDRYWRIPHFEKMLYDNGQLASVYARAYELTKRDDYRHVVEEMLTFIKREMQDQGGGFYAALDAESEGQEGKYYVWTKAELSSLLSASEMELVTAVYGLGDEPNFEEDTYAPQLSQSLADAAQTLKLTEAELHEKLVPIRAKLLTARNQRKRPLTDTKILTAWNGLMIRGFADAGRSLQHAEYIATAQRAADFVLQNLRTKDGRLLRTYSQGQAKLNAYLDDYAFFIDGLISLHQATDDKRWIDAATELMDLQIASYHDAKNGGFYFTSNDHESLIARGRNPVDGARPAGNSISARNLLYLAKHADKPEYLNLATGAIQSSASLLQRSPAAAPMMALALDELLATQQEQ
ncbi:MAG: thioredoxin domain-containing protein [Blastopirellula sp.]|nr:thioredoxin domain-containing protein [Blastopirellula sp.]